MLRVRHRLLYPLLAALCLLPQLALAEPKPPTEEESADVSFAKSFLGNSYDDELEIEGWIDLGGGLVSPPIYVRHYQREDGTDLVLTSKEVVPAAANTPASFVVTDALVLPKPAKDVEFSLACVQGDDPMLRFIGQAKGSEDKEWWTDVRRAWEISIETGEIGSIKAKGVRCTNPGW